MENKANRRRIREKKTLIKVDVEELRKHGCNKYIIKHCKLVMKISERIVRELKIANVIVDEMIVLRGAVLHDIGRSKEQSVRHGFWGGEILRKDGYDRRIIKVVENHVGGGIPKEEGPRLGLPRKDFIPNSLEEKIVCLADKYVEDNQIKPLEETLKKLDEKLGKENLAKKRILKIKEELESLIQKKIEFVIKEN